MCCCCEFGSHLFLFYSSLPFFFIISFSFFFSSSIHLNFFFSSHGFRLTADASRRHRLHERGAREEVRSERREESGDGMPHGEIDSDLTQRLRVVVLDEVWLRMFIVELEDEAVLFVLGINGKQCDSVFCLVFAETNIEAEKTFHVFFERPELLREKLCCDGLFFHQK